MNRLSRLGALTAVIGLVFAASAGPAAATHSPVTGGDSTGGGEGWELGPNGDGFCNINGAVGVQFETTYYDISHASATYDVKNHNGVSVAKYVGPVAMRIDHGDMVSLPTHSEPGECVDADGVAGTIALTAGTVDDTSSGSGVVNCDMTSTNGTYQRVTDDDITMVFDLNCSVTGNQTGATSTVNNVSIRHTVTGFQVPCFEIPGGCSNTDAGAELTTSFGLSNP